MKNKSIRKKGSYGFVRRRRATPYHKLQNRPEYNEMPSQKDKEWMIRTAHRLIQIWPDPKTPISRDAVVCEFGSADCERALQVAQWLKGTVEDASGQKTTRHDAIKQTILDIRRSNQ